MKDMSEAGFPHADGVKVIAGCTLRVAQGNWPFAEENAAAIDDNWEQAKRTNPNYFNGIVYLMQDAAYDGLVMDAALVRSDFKTYLYWRQQGFPEAGVIDGFGSALIRSCDGHFMLITQRAGNVNHGFAYLPSGFIDQNDVQPDGTIDIGRSVERELEEEIGEVADTLRRDEGYIAVREGVHLSFAVPFHLPITSDEFIAMVARHNEITHDPEIDTVIPVGRLEDLDGLKILPYARALLEALLVAR
jgi:hypothetical protein